MAQQGLALAVELQLPLELGRAAVLLVEQPPQRLQVRVQPAQRRQRLAAAHLQVEAEDGAGGAVGGHQRAVGVEADHAGRQVLQQRVQVGALLLDGEPAGLGDVAAVRQPLGHAVEGVRQMAQLVAAVGRQAAAVLAGGHRLEAARQLRDRREDALRLPLKYNLTLVLSLAQLQQPAVGAGGPLDAVGQPGHVLGGRVARLQHQRQLAAQRRHLQQRVADRAVLRVLLLRQVGAVLAQQLQPGLVRAVERDVDRLALRGEDLVAGVEQRRLQGAGAVHQVVGQRHRVGRVADIAGGLQQALDLVAALAQLRVDRGAAELAGLVQGVVDADVEPAVDPGRQ